MKEYSVIGKPYPQRGSVQKATGRAKYIEDIYLPGMLYGKILRSPYAHAKIINIDTSEAEKLPGVMAVITGADIPKVQSEFLGPLGGADRYALAVGKVRFVGEEVATVAADDEDTAEEALELIQVEYEELPEVFDPEEAMKPDAPIIHERVGNNIAYEIHHSAGDIEKGFAEADYIREDRFETPMVQAAFIGPRGAVADYDPVIKKLTLYTEATMPFTSRGPLAQVLDMPVSNIRVIRPYIGGGFGEKSRVTIDVCFCASFLSMHLGRPVKIMHTRAEEFLTCAGRQPVVTYLKTGVMKDGTLVARQLTRISNTGASVGGSESYAKQDVGIFELLFRCPNTKFDSYSVYTNLTPSGTLRSLTNNALSFGIHSHMDMLARDLGVNVADFYLKNAHQQGDITHAQYKLDSCGLSECIQKVIEASKFKERQGKLGKGRGLGFATAGHTCGYKHRDWLPDLSTAEVLIDRDGNVRLLSGRAESGMGPGTMQIMCVAEELGIPPDDVDINEFVDTDITPFESGNYASRGTIQQGNAAMAAARNVRVQLFEVAAPALSTTPDNLEAKDSRIFIKGSPERGISFKEAVKAYEAAGKVLPLIGRGSYNPPTIAWNEHGEGNNSIAYGFGAQVIEVEVDNETGKVEVVDVVSAMDCGKVINPLILDGESEGAINMGIGMALLEQISYDEKGRMLGTSYTDYRLPTVWEQPSVKTMWVETIDPYGPYGAKGITETVGIPTALAIANAVYDAVGVRIRKLPITPDKILDGLREKETSK
jgi:CO/xanthine dehydrogenase Mo-binding subunit